MPLQHTLFPSLLVSLAGCPHCSPHSTDVSPLIVLLLPLCGLVTSHTNNMTTTLRLQQQGTALFSPKGSSAVDQ